MLSTLLEPHCSHILPAAAALISTLGLTWYLLFSSAHPVLPDYIPSPRVLLSSLSKEEIAALPYPPDFYPGGRWVKTPHGTIRVYEFGPEMGKKVLLIHGISSPCYVFRDLAWRLADEGGCRVMLFDLYGRGWSDSPLNIRFDASLYNTQMLHALLSSDLPWLSPQESFSIIGYSLGGSLVPTFLLSLPPLQLASIDSAILLAPAGLLQVARLAFLKKLGYRGWLPTALQTFVAQRHMRRSVKELLEKQKPGDSDSSTMSVDSVTEWQARTHRGYLPAWISSFQCCPIFDQHHIWSQFRTLAETNAFGALSERTQPNKVFIILAGKDDTVKFNEVVPALRQIFAQSIGDVDGQTQKEAFVKWKVYENDGHDLVATKGIDIADEILHFWGLKEPREPMAQSWVHA